MIQESLLAASFGYSNQWRIENFPEELALPGGGGGAPTYEFAKFSQKLHEIERILPGGVHSWGPLRSATGNDSQYIVVLGKIFIY